MTTLAILIVAAFLRVYRLELAPLHHDEGVNGFFLVRLFRNNIYSYDPGNYHGPTLYYFAVLSAGLFGLTTFAIRIVPAAFGVTTVWLTLRLKSRLGYPAALVAAALIAMSPGAVYLSRYFIHETLFVFFTLAALAAALRYRDTGTRRHLVIAAIWAALLFATKETAVISAAVLLIACLLPPIYIRLRRKNSNDPGDAAGDRDPTGYLDGGLLSLNEGSRRWFGDHWLPAAGCFIVISALLYSSFLSNPRGAIDALRTFEFWVRTGRSEHTHAWYQYLSWLRQEEWPLLALGLAGSLVAVWRADSRFGVAATLWTTGLIVAYSVLPYKTPWLTLNFIVPLALVGGYGVGALGAGRESPWRRWLVGAFVVSSLVILGYKSISLAFYHYDDDRYAYVYAHTRREFLSLVQEIEQLAGQSGQGRDISIAVTATDYWPLPWYLRDYTRVGYYGKATDSNDDIVVGSEDQSPALDSLLGDRYLRGSCYLLRPGVSLVIYTRRDMRA